MTSNFQNALDMLYGKPGEWTYSNADNEPDPDFNERYAKRRLKELRRLTRLADDAGYRFDADDSPTPRHEIRELERKLFIGPRELTPVLPPSEFTEAMLDRVFTSSPIFEYLLGE